MRRTNDLAVLIEQWFTDRLMKHRGVSSNTIASYRDTFRLLFAFAQPCSSPAPSQLLSGSSNSLLSRRRLPCCRSVSFSRNGGADARRNCCSLGHLHTPFAAIYRGWPSHPGGHPSPKRRSPRVVVRNRVHRAFCNRSSSAGAGVDACNVDRLESCRVVGRHRGDTCALPAIVDRVLPRPSGKQPAPTQGMAPPSA